MRSEQRKVNDVRWKCVARAVGIDGGNPIGRCGFEWCTVLGRVCTEKEESEEGERRRDRLSTCASVRCDEKDYMENHGSARYVRVSVIKMI